MTLEEKDGRWYARKKKTAKRLEDVTDIIEFPAPDVCAVMGTAGRTEFHSYMQKPKDVWFQMRGVTSVLNKWGDKDGLIQWAVDRAVDSLPIPAPQKEWDTNMVYMPREEYLGALKQARRAHKRHLKDAGDHGTTVHQEVEDYINFVMEHGGKPATVRDGSDSAREFMKWAVYENVTFLASEKVMFSRELNLAGTCDAIMEWNGKRYIVDVKTSNSVKPINFLQCGAYALLNDEPIDGFLIIHLPRSGGIKTWTEKEVGQTVDNLQNGYKALLQLDEMDEIMKNNLYV